MQVATVVAALGPAPTVTSSTANLAANAASMTIAGTGFSTTPANNIVTFSNGATGTVTAATATQLTVSLTTAPTAGSLTASGVHARRGQRHGGPSGHGRCRSSPAATASLPINATTITINGYGFDPTASHNTVTFNNGATGTVTTATATSLTVTFGTKPTAVGSLTAVVTTDGVRTAAARCRWPRSCRP